MKIFDSVAQMKLATIKAGQYVETFGYYTKGDAGAARYLVVASQAADGYGDHTLVNGTVAVLQTGKSAYASTFGITGTSDSSDAFEVLLSQPVTIVIDTDVLLTRDIVFSENVEIDVEFINNAKILGIGYAPRLRSNPEHRITSDYSRQFIGKSIYDNGRHEQGFAVDVISEVDNSVGDFKNVVGAYFGADSLGATQPRLWALNTVTNVHTGHDGLAEAFGYELDVNIDIGIDYSLITAPIAGLYIAGAGDLATVAGIAPAMWVRRTGSGLYNWKEGLKLQECVDGVVMDSSISRHTMLAFQTDASYKHVPATQDGSSIFEVFNPANTQRVTSINNDGAMSLPAITVGGGAKKTFDNTYFAPSVGTGNVAAQSSVDLLFSTVFGANTINWGSSEITITPTFASAAPSGFIVTSYIDTAAGQAKIRFTNVTNTTINNFGLNLRAFVRSY